MSTLMAKLNAPGQGQAKQRKIAVGVAALLVVAFAGSKVVGGSSNSTTKAKPKLASTTAASGTGQGSAATATAAPGAAGTASGASSTVPYTTVARNPFAFGTAPRDAVAATNIQSASALAEAVRTEQGSWSTVTAERLRAADPSLFAADADAPSTGPTVISWHRTGKADSEDGIVVAARTTEGHCYLMRHSLSGFAFGTFDVSGDRPCAATDAPSTWGPTQASWTGA